MKQEELQHSFNVLERNNLIPAGKRKWYQNVSNSTPSGQQKQYHNSSNNNSSLMISYFSKKYTMLVPEQVG